MFLSQVEAARKSNCILIGDFNLDFIKWTKPDKKHEELENCTKNSLETAGYVQLVKGITRSWPGQVDSAIDHIWTNSNQRVISVANVVSAAGDHNLISTIIRIKVGDSRRLEERKRVHKNFDPVTYRQKLEMEDWSEIYKLDNCDLANDFIETKLMKILDEVCPIKNIQMKKNYNSWISIQTKELMLDRDNKLEVARNSGDPAAWKEYSKIRNRVNAKIDKDRKVHYKKLYEIHQDNNDVSATFRTAKQHTGWKATSKPVSFNIDGKLVSAPREMADKQMNVFHNKTRKLLDQLLPPNNRSTVQPTGSN